MKICHIADIQIRFGNRHEEYKQIFEKTYADVQKQNPDRIFVAGDLFHHKINISPMALELASEFLISLSRIAPTDVILGNHDINLQQLDQGDSISPIFKIANLLGVDTAVIVSEENKYSINLWNNSIYFFPDSGLYDLDETTTYVVFSCKDNQLPKITNKDSARTYIALYHGQLYGARGDNGYLLNGDNLFKPSLFDDFDLVLMGDIHEYQSFDRPCERLIDKGELEFYKSSGWILLKDIGEGEVLISKKMPTMAYAGSLIQQNFGESIDKGYLVWDTVKKTHERRYILNDTGYAKIVIARGEDFQERIDNIKFSQNKRKTKVQIVWEDYEENRSIEKDSQIKKYVKDHYGCESVNVQFKGLVKTIFAEDDEEQILEKPKTSEDYLVEYLTEQEHDCDKEMLKDIMELHAEITKELKISEVVDLDNKWELDSLEVSNIFSFPIKPIKINFNDLQGIVGLFGESYNGKSNVVKALVWGLYREILGGGESKYLVNIYTGASSGYVKIYLTINGSKYMIHRTVKTIRKKDGTISNTYGIEYKKNIITYDADHLVESESWEKEKSDEKTTEKNEVGKLVEKAIGTFEDFTKVSLQTQSGSENYLNMKQQPKNDLIARYLGLEHYRDRYEYANKFFNEIKKKQKDIGDISLIEEEISNIKFELDLKDKELAVVNTEKTQVNETLERHNSAILELTKKLLPVERMNSSETLESLEENVSIHTKRSETFAVELKRLEEWVSNNPLTELSVSEDDSIEKIESALNTARSQFDGMKKEYLKLEGWIKSNPKKDVIDMAAIQDSSDAVKKILEDLKNQVAIAKGKNCPTCNGVISAPDPKKAKELEALIATSQLELKSLSDKRALGFEVAEFNSSVDMSMVKLDGLRSLLVSKKEIIDNLKSKFELIEKSAGLIEKNKEVRDSMSKISTYRQQIESGRKLIENNLASIEKIKKNKEAQEKNTAFNIEIANYEELRRIEKLKLFNLDKKSSECLMSIGSMKNQIKINQDKLRIVKEAQYTYKKYSLYLQSMHRDGIPALIIKKKLPIINYIINSMLNDIVNFELDFNVNESGDVVESFYFSEDKSDALPLSFGSGAQKFLSSVAIKEALHYASHLTKPSLSIIDEGFGVLDNKLTIEVVKMLNHLKNTHKNVIILTHKSEIKDFADFVIEVKKVTDSIPSEILAKNPDAGVSRLTIQ